MGAGTPVAAFTARQALKAYLRRRLDTFCNPLVYTFAHGREPVITTLSRALAEGEPRGARCIYITDLATIEGARVAPS
jgi:hypothetical protein